MRVRKNNMDGYLLVQFAKEIGKTTAQLTLSDMLKFNKWRLTEKKEDKPIELPISNRFTRMVLKL